MIVHTEDVEGMDIENFNILVYRSNQICWLDVMQILQFDQLRKPSVNHNCVNK